MKKLVFGVFLAFFTLSLISASFQAGNSSGIEKQYSLSDYLRGWVNISFSNQLADSLFSDSFSNSIKLIDLLKLNGVNYTCNPSDCSADYSATNPQTEKTFALNKNDEKIIGFNLTGSNFDSISSFTMNVSSTATESSSPQLYIDILNDGGPEWVSYKPSNNFQVENYGCYGSPSEQVLVYNQPYCNKISMPVSPNVKIGANIISASGGNATFDLGICSQDFTNCQYCNANANTSGKISCTANISISGNRDYFVCLNTKSSADNNKYKINSETENACGYASSADNPRDFDIFVMPGMYSAVNNFTLNDKELENYSFVNIEGHMGDYIGRFGNNCSKGCIVPIRFASKQDQQIILSGVDMLYTAGGTPREITKAYDLAETAPKITTPFQKLYFDDANFSVSGKANSTIDYVLSFNNQNIVSDKLQISKTPTIRSLNPKTVIAAYPTKFTVVLENLDANNSNALTYIWDFGDGKTETTGASSVSHTFGAIGNYTLRITIRDLGFSSSRQFSISVLTPKNAINSLLAKQFGYLNTTNFQIQSFSPFEQSSLSAKLNFSEINNKISSIQQKNQAASTDNDYVRIMSELVALNVPKGIYESKNTGNLLFFPGKDIINVNTISQVTLENYSVNNEDAYKDAVVAWSLNKTNVKISESEVSADYDDFTETVINFFKMNIAENQARESSYLIMKKLDGLKFKENYGEQEVGDYVYIAIPKEGKSIEFSTTGVVDFENLPLFISPKISDLPKTTINLSTLGDKISKNVVLTLSIIFALFIGFVAYLVLQEWYKRRYETYLFGNRNDLFNIVSYIENSYKKGLANREIEAKLKKSGWTSEQISYVMRKYAGKRTGMFEIPISKLFDLFKKDSTKKT